VCVCVCVCVCLCVSLIVWPGLTHAEIIAQGILFFLGGFENTANTLSFLAYQLAVNTDCQDKVIQEIDNVMNGQVRQPCCIHAVTELWRESKHCCLNSICYRCHRFRCLCVLGTQMSCAKTAELIDMPFEGRQTHVGSRNHLLDGVRIGSTWRIWLNDLYTAAMRPMLNTLTIC